MGFRWTSAAAILAAFPLALAGCSQQAPAPSAAPKPRPQAKPPPNAAPAPPRPESIAWADQMCSLVGGFSAAQQQAPGVDKSSREAFKNSSVTQIAAAEKTANDTLNGLRAMGPSPIPGGEPVNDTFVTGFTQVRDILHAAKGKAEQVDVRNDQAFATGMIAVQEELKKGGGVRFDAQFAQFDKNVDLNAAANAAPTCRALASPPPAPPRAPQPPR